MTKSTGPSIKIIEHKYLEPGTIWVSSDIATYLRQAYTAAGKDEKFLRMLGINPEPIEEEKWEFLN